MRFGLTVLAFLATVSAANAQQQQVLQGGSPVPPVQGHAPFFIDDALIGDSGPASGGPPFYGITDLNLTNNTGIAPLCVNDAPITTPGGFHQTCLGSNVNGQGGSLKYATKAGAPSLPFTVQAAGILAFNSNTRAITLKNLPQTVAGDVPVCVNSATGQLFQASVTPVTLLLQDDNTGALLTDDTGTFLLTASLPAGSCIQQ